MLVQAVTYPIRVTFHVVCAMANYWLDVPETVDLVEWPDDEVDPWSPAVTTEAAPHLPQGAGNPELAGFSPSGEDLRPV